MRLLLLKYSNLVENKSPPRRFGGVIYLKLGNKNASDLHRGGKIEYLQGMKDMRRNSPRCHFGRVMLSRGRSWSRIWQIWGKSLIDDTDMGRTGDERRRHQLNSTININIQKQHVIIAKYKIYKFFYGGKFSFNSCVVGSKSSPPYRCFQWKQRLRRIYAQSHFTSFPPLLSSNRSISILITHVPFCLDCTLRWKIFF